MKTAARMFLSLLGLVLLSSCAAVSLVDSWRDPTFSRSFKRYLVVVDSDQQEWRQVLEEVLAGELKLAGVDAVASHVFSSGNRKMSKETLAAAVKKSGADAVIRTSVTGVQQVNHVQPGYASFQPGGFPVGYYDDYYSGFGGYGFYDSSMVYSPPTVDTWYLTFMQTSLFDAENNRMVWSATTNTDIPDNTVTVGKDLARVVVKELIGAGLM